MKTCLACISAVLFLSAGTSFGKPLKKVYSRDFLMGVALSENVVMNQNSEASRKALETTRREFGCVTSENLMKPSALRPAPGRYNFENADRFVDLAGRLDLAVVGHVLVWHSQTPDWFFKDESGQPVSREQLIKTMRDHIHTVVTRYKGRVKYWDVVNEAVDVRRVDDPDNPGRRISQGFFRESPWFRILGEEYIALAFRFAHEADPDAVLIYNDYGMTDPAKTDFVVNRIVRPLKKKGVHIDAVGMQGHWQLDTPSLEEIDRAIEKLAEAKVKVHITELDLSVLPTAWGYTGADISVQYDLQDELNPYPDGLPDDVAEKQAKRYRAVFDVLKSRKRDVERVTLWGLCDGDSWKNNFPVRGRTDYPLLFDRNCEPKPAYDALVK